MRNRIGTGLFNYSIIDAREILVVAVCKDHNVLQ